MKMIVQQKDLLRKPLRYGIIWLLLLVMGSGLGACTRTVYVHQNQQSYNDYKAHKYNKVNDKTKWPNRKKKNK